MILDQSFKLLRKDMNIIQFTPYHHINKNKHNFVLLDDRRIEVSPYRCRSRNSNNIEH
jgi:hypothetical protein